MHTKAPYRLSALLFFLVLHALVGCSEKSGSSAYNKNGLSFDLPKNWEVFEDHQGAAHYRSVSIATHVGSIVTFDIYKNTDASIPANIRSYLGKYVELALPEELGEEAQIDYGEVYQSGAEGMFVKIFIPDPHNIHFLIETYLKQARDRTAYITFNTPADLVSETQPHIDKFLKGIRLE